VIGHAWRLQDITFKIKRKERIKRKEKGNYFLSG
jgi:hypothetical protein